MKKRRPARMIAAAVVTAVLLTALTACGKKATMGSEPNDETGGFDVTAENIYESGNSGNVTIAEGECLVVSPQLSKGHFVIKVVPEEQVDAAMEETKDGTLPAAGGEFPGTDNVLEAVAEGSVMSAYSLQPGDYYVFVMAEKEKTTGTLSIMPYNIEELRTQNASLVEALDELPVDFDISSELPDSGENPEPASASEPGSGAEAGGESDGQNPVMNFVGPYVCDRAQMLIEADGQTDAKVTVSWGSSAFESAQWEMSGPFDTETLTIEYSNCVKKVVVYDKDGKLESETVEYENGTGRITFPESGDLQLIWEDDQEHAADGSVFEWSFPAP